MLAIVLVLPYYDPMYVEIVPNRNSPPAVLLREGRREGRKVVKRTLANLSDWPTPKVDLLRRLLRDEPLAPPDQIFSIERSWPHGHVQAVLGTLRRLGVDRLIATQPSHHRDLVLGMIAERLLHPASKLATTRLWKTTTLAQELKVEEADVDELYAALVWLRGRQPAIEKKLAARHLREGALVLYDVSSSYYEGRTCPLARFGHDRDGKGLAIIVYGVLTDAQGRPIAVEVYPGNTGDPSTVADQVEKLRERFGLGRVVLVGDRGMLTQTRLEQLRLHEGIGWISALRGPAIRALVEGGALQLSLFDQQNLAEISSPAYPGERLVACFNPLLAEDRRRTREELLAATEKELTRIQCQAARRTRTPLGDDELGVKVGRVINRWKVGKHFDITIREGRLEFSRRTGEIAREEKLDGIYIVRTSEPEDRLSAPDAVRGYKGLSQVERAFRCLKGLDLRIRPIHHHKEETVRAHIFLCLLAYYVEWEMRRLWAPLLFEDEQLLSDRATRDSVAPAQASQSAKRKKAARTTNEGYEIHSFDTLLAELATRNRNQCRVKSDPQGPVFHQLTQPTPFQHKALQLLGLSQ